MTDLKPCPICSEVANGTDLYFEHAGGNTLGRPILRYNPDKYEVMPIHGSTTQDSTPPDKGETCGDCDLCAALRTDPDCAECEKPEQWEALEERLRDALDQIQALQIQQSRDAVDGQNALDDANHRIGELEHRNKVINKRNEIQAHTIADMRAERDAARAGEQKASASAKRYGAELIGARAEVERLREGIRLVAIEMDTYGEERAASSIYDLRALLEPKQEGDKCDHCGTVNTVNHAIDCPKRAWVSVKGKPTPPDSLKKARETPRNLWETIDHILDYLESERGKKT